MSESENKAPGQHPEVDMRDVLRERFSSGQGFIQLNSGMTDEMMLFMIKQAISLSNGKAFTVIPPSKIDENAHENAGVGVFTQTPGAGTSS